MAGNLANHKFKVPSGTKEMVCSFYPALKRWAIFKIPVGIPIFDRALRP
jgi:hypothetical protein